MPRQRHLFAIACAALALAAVGAPVRADPMPPEDPVKGAAATAQWRKHLEEEEHERRLFYDRDRLKEHRAVLKLLVAARARYDRAKSKTAVLAVQKGLPPTVDDVRRRITQIDQWGTNSNLLIDYEAYLKALSDGYPAARIESFEGRADAQATIRRDLDQRTRHIKEWLAEAAASKNEEASERRR